MLKRYHFMELSPEAIEIAISWFENYGPGYWGGTLTRGDIENHLMDEYYPFDVSGKRLYDDGEMEG